MKPIAFVSLILCFSLSVKINSPTPIVLLVAALASLSAPVNKSLNPLWSFKTALASPKSTPVILTPSINSASTALSIVPLLPYPIIEEALLAAFSLIDINPKKADEIANGVISGWNELKNFAGGASAVEITYWGKKWLKKKYQSSMRSPTNSSTHTFDAKNIATNPKTTTTHLTTSDTSTSHSFKDMGGLTGEPPSKAEVLKTKAMNSIEKNWNKVKKLAPEVLDRVFKIIEKGALPFTLAEFVYDANQAYHGALNNGYSIGMAFVLGGLAGAGKLFYDNGNALSFGLLGEVINKINPNVAYAKEHYNKSNVL